MVSDVDVRELNLSWDERYQLSTVNVGSGTNVNYGYNVLGQRISRIELIDGVANTEYYVHDGVNVIADLDENKELLRSYTYASGYDNIISMTIYEEAETNTYFYIRNHNNSVVALIDESGNIAESYEYTAYGEVTVFDANGNELEKSALGNRYAFQGREIDWTTGLYNFRARWYDPETGRWLSKDPIGINGGLNQYVFCGNNPVMFGDPEGLEGEYGYWHRYYDYLDDNLIKIPVFSGCTLIGEGVMPKSCVPRTGGRPPLLGSKNPITSVPRGLIGAKWTKLPAARMTFAGVACVGVAVGSYNIGVMLGGFIDSLWCE